jgi:hypothetical protein
LPNLISAASKSRKPFPGNCWPAQTFSRAGKASSPVLINPRFRAASFTKSEGFGLAFAIGVFVPRAAHRSGETSARPSDSIFIKPQLHYTKGFSKPWEKSKTAPLLDKGLGECSF